MKSNITLSTSRTVQTLEFLATHKNVRFKNLAEGLGGISHASLSRLLEDLVALGCVVKSDGLYALGTTRVGILRMPAHIPAALSAGVQSELNFLSMGLELSCGLFGRLGEQTMKILSTVTVEDQPGFSPLGREMILFPGHGFAKIFLAWASDNQRLELFQRRDESPYKIPLEYRSWIEDLDAARRLGRVLESEAHQEGIVRCVVPVFERSGADPVMALGAIGRPGILSRANEIFDSLEKARDRIAALLFPESSRKETKS